MKRQKGFTLIELLVTLTVGSTLMALSVGMVHQTMRLSKATQRKLVQNQSLRLFAAQFRRDVHNAILASCDSDQHLVLQFDDDSAVVYRTTKNHIGRERMTADGEQHLSQLTMAEAMRSQFEVHSGPERAVWTVVAEGELPGVQRKIRRRVESAIGRSVHTPIEMEPGQ